MLVPAPPDLQQLALVVLFLPSTSANTLRAFVVVIITLGNLRCWSSSWKHWCIYCMRLLQLALCDGGGDICKNFTYLTFSCAGGVFLSINLRKHSTCTQGVYPQELALVVLFLVVLAHLLHAQIATCTAYIVVVVMVS